MFTETLMRLLHQEPFLSIDTVVWDLDGCLGPLPGWDPDTLLERYIVEAGVIRQTVLTLQRHRIDSILVSRNAAFCGAAYIDANKQVGEVLLMPSYPCSRTRRDVAKTQLIEHDDPSRVLLIDDSKDECLLAAETGSVAFHLPTVAVDAIPKLKFMVLDGR
jgi:hypothetical protein